MSYAQLCRNLRRCKRILWAHVLTIQSILTILSISCRTAQSAGAMFGPDEDEDEEEEIVLMAVLEAINCDLNREERGESRRVLIDYAFASHSVSPNVSKFVTIFAPGIAVGVGLAYVCYS